MVLYAVIVLLVGTIWANLLKKSSITRMASYLWASWRLVMKSMEILCYGLDGIGNSCSKPTYLIELELHTNLYKVDYFFIHPLLLTLLWPSIELLWSSFKAKSYYFPWGTYTWLCLYLSNPSTNIISLSFFPFLSSTSNLCVSRPSIYPFLIRHFKCPSSL